MDGWWEPRLNLGVGGEEDGGGVGVFLVGGRIKEPPVEEGNSGETDLGVVFFSFLPVFIFFSFPPFFSFFSLSLLSIASLRIFPDASVAVLLCSAFLSSLSRPRR